MSAPRLHKNTESAMSPPVRRRYDVSSTSVRRMLPRVHAQVGRGGTNPVQLGRWRQRNLMSDAFTEKKLNWDSEGQPLIDRQRLLCDVLFSTRSCSSRTMRDKSCSTGTLETAFHYVVASTERSSSRTQKSKSSSTEDASVTNQSPWCHLLGSVCRRP